MDALNRFDLARIPLRDVNAALHGEVSGEFVIDNPATPPVPSTSPALAAGLTVSFSLRVLANGMPAGLSPWRMRTASSPASRPAS